MPAGDWKDLYKAADEGNLALVKAHIANGVNPNYQHPEILRTVLVTAIKRGHTDIAIYLLQNGADPKLESYFDKLTPLNAAIKFKNKTVLEELKTMGVRQAWLKRVFFN